MQQGNEHIDDLFRKAADHYPLNTKSSDWEKFNEEFGRNSGVYLAKSVNQKFYLSAKKWAAALVLVLVPMAIAEVKPSRSGQPGAGMRTLQVPIVITQHSNDEPEAMANFGVLKSTALVAQSNRMQANTSPLTAIEHGDIAAASVAEINTKDKSLFLTAIAEQKGPVAELRIDKQLSINSLEFEKAPTISNGSEVQHSPPEKQSRFYFGAVVAPEYTRVKLQQFSKPGINFGVIAGFQLNKNLSLELGMLLTKKYYYSDGKYLSKNSLSRDGSDIISLDAYNSITEIPFGVKYNFKQQKKGGFFASAGAVSYVMHKELYNYSYDANGQQKEGVKYVNKAANYYFSNIHLSVGYERQISKNGMLRVEPYYRIPISGIGINDLPVTSLGINLALTTKLK